MSPSQFERVNAPGEQPGLALLACAVLFSAWYAAPEMRINRVPLNDLAFHVAASERMETAFARGEPFLDAWVSEWDLGYPVWRSYQPLPHAAAALVLWLFRGFGDPAAIFAVLYYLLLVTFPMSVYLGARLLGLPPPAAGLAALLALAPSAAGDADLYGLGYGSVVWRGLGLYTQLFALHLMVISTGMCARALDTGERKQRVLAGLLLALTALAHIVFGYAAFVSAAVVAVVGPGGRRRVRLVRLATVVLPALLLLAWFVVPLVLARDVVNHSRFEPAMKWDSYGARFILGELFSGRLLDFGRLPLLTILLAAGTLGAFLSYRDARARRLLALSVLWLVLFFGRATWGRLITLAGVPADFPLHRLQGVFELYAVLLGSYGLVWWMAWAAQRRRWLVPAGGIAVALAVVAIGADRAAYLNQNQAWGEENLATYQAERPDLEAALADVRAILAERPGRVSAGVSVPFSSQFKIGTVPVYAVYAALSLGHFDQTSFLYHAMSKTADIMASRDEHSLAHDVALGIRAVIAPADRRMPAYLRRRGVHGSFAVYESSHEGYFGIVDLAGHYVGLSSTDYEASIAWLNSPLPSRGLVISLDPRAQPGPPVQRWEAMPNPSAEQAAPRGRVLGETKTGETYSAVVEAVRPAYAFIKITWNPDLAATVDGRQAPVIHVTPGFGAVPIPAGRHEVSVAYQPGLLKPVLFVLGLGAFVLVWSLRKAGVAAR